MKSNYKRCCIQPLSKRLIAYLISIFFCHNSMKTDKNSIIWSVLYKISFSFFHNLLQNNLIRSSLLSQADRMELYVFPLLDRHMDGRYFNYPCGHRCERFGLLHHSLYRRELRYTHRFYLYLQGEEDRFTSHPAS